MEQGYIKIFRSIIHWEWYSCITTTRLYMHLLLKANYKQKIWKGETIDIGELITSLHNLSLETNLTKDAIRWSFEKLKKTGEITIETTNRYTKIIINNYQNYQTPHNTPHNTPHKTTHDTPHQIPRQTPHQTPHDTPHQNNEIQAQNNEKITNNPTLHTMPNTTPNNTLNTTPNNIQTTRQTPRNTPTTKEEKNIKNINNINNNINIIVQKWNEFCKSLNNDLNPVSFMTEKRKKKISARLKENDFDFDLILEKIRNSDQLQGKVYNWRVTFDWIFTSKANYIKILEGNYQNKEKVHLNALEAQMDKIKSVMDAI